MACVKPVEALEVALDGLCALEELFYYRYRILSAVHRRAGGQGVVQFASITYSDQRARSRILMSTA